MTRGCAPGFGSNLVTGSDAGMQLAKFAELADCLANIGVLQNLEGHA